MSRDECVDLLASRTLGRIGLTAGSLPYVLPVRYVLETGRIFLRTGRGTRMEAATTGAVVAFEVDDFDPLTVEGWSVTAQGLARPVDRADLPSAIDAVLTNWFGSTPTQSFAFDLQVLAGQRFGPPVDQRPVT